MIDGPEPTSPGLSRRAMLAGAAVAPVAAIPAVAGEPRADAAVLALCAEADRMERAYQALFDEPTRIIDDDEREAAMRSIWAVQEPLLDRLCATESATVAGIVAKLKSVTLADADALTDFPLLLSALRDVARLDGADLTRAPHLRPLLEGVAASGDAG